MIARFPRALTAQRRYAATGRPMSSREPTHHPEELLLLDYVIGQLPAETRDQVKRHVASCRACSRTIDDLILTVVELDRLPTMPIPHDSPADLRPPRLRPKSRIRWFVPVLGVVLLALLALVTFGGGRNAKPELVQTVNVNAANAAQIQAEMPEGVVVQTDNNESFAVFASASDIDDVLTGLRQLEPGTKPVVVVSTPQKDLDGLVESRASQAQPAVQAK
jgi:anti-sigma factor RsiW